MLCPWTPQFLLRFIISLASVWNYAFNLEVGSIIKSLLIIEIILEFIVDDPVNFTFLLIASTDTKLYFSKVSKSSKITFKFITNFYVVGFCVTSSSSDVIVFINDYSSVKSEF